MMLKRPRYLRLILLVGDYLFGGDIYRAISGSEDEQEIWSDGGVACSFIC